MTNEPSQPTGETIWTPRATGDGSFTFFSETFQEAFHSKQGARTEAIEKFAIATHLPRLARAASPLQHPLRILDVCYGLGVNTAAALETIWQVNPDCPVELYGLELDASVPLAAIAPHLIQSWSPTVQTVLRALAQHHAFPGHVSLEHIFPGQAFPEVEPSGTAIASQAQSKDPLDSPTSPTPLTAHLLIGDARQTITRVQAQGFQADAIFFDPFSPRRCPQLWTVDFFQQVARCLAPQGRLATYSRSASVRSALRQAGFRIGTMPLPNPDPHHPHEWSQGTLAVLSNNSSSDTDTMADLTPLSLMEEEHLQTRAGIPFRDPQLSDDAPTILARQQAEQQAASVESTSSWRRRWGLG